MKRRGLLSGCAAGVLALAGGCALDATSHPSILVECSGTCTEPGAASPGGTGSTRSDGGTIGGSFGGFDEGGPPQGLQDASVASPPGEPTAPGVGPGPGGTTIPISTGGGGTGGTQPQSDAGTGTGGTGIVIVM
jgi:hypothetical protein